jgi:hypothetical protein
MVLQIFSNGRKPDRACTIPLVPHVMEHPHRVLTLRFARCVHTHENRPYLPTFRQVRGDLVEQWTCLPLTRTITDAQTRVVERVQRSDGSEYPSEKKRWRLSQLRLQYTVETL